VAARRLACALPRRRARCGVVELICRASSGRSWSAIPGGRKPVFRRGHDPVLVEPTLGDPATRTSLAGEARARVAPGDYITCWRRRKKTRRARPFFVDMQRAPSPFRICSARFHGLAARSRSATLSQALPLQPAEQACRLTLADYFPTSISTMRQGRRDPGPRPPSCWWREHLGGGRVNVVGLRLARGG